MSQYKNKELLQNIANRLKQLREQRELTQQQVYADTEIHIARIETAKRNVTVTTIAELCKYFKVSLTDFFEGIEL